MDLADELERLVRPGDRVGAVDLLDLFEHLAQALGAAEGLEGLDLLGRGAAWADADAKAPGLDLLAWNLGIPEGQDVARVGRAHRQDDLRCSHVRIGRELRFKVTSEGSLRRDLAPQWAAPTVPDLRVAGH